MKECADCGSTSHAHAITCRISFADPPFAVPPDVVLDLPPPISVNRLWRASKRSVIRSREYDRWVQEADLLLLQTRQLKNVKTIYGRFAVVIVVKRSNLDLDNNSKSVLDYLQRCRVIENDKFCEEMTLRWGEAPTGCRVTVKVWQP